ncbi:MAG: ABC transporter ATP-binding protein, partial [Oscillospiraceae bacterium]|nr:ABC transporter ATP-binding protein [Oscillospiraceae bacterium]
MNLIPDPPGKIVQGEILYEGEDLLKKSSHEMQSIRGNKISMIFQDPMTALNPIITVEDQVMEVIRLHQKCSTGEARIAAVKMLEKVGIKAERSQDYPHQFSGGMKQRVLIAMALACDPQLLIADEPTTALDVTIQAQVLNLMRDLKCEMKTAMLLITHDLGIVAETCDRVAIMYAGEIVEIGTLEDIFHRTKHPYTKGLFNSIPSLDKDVRRLESIPGLMPDPAALPSGCRFHPRCKYRSPQCETDAPILAEISPGHLCRCHLAQEGGAIDG